MLNAYLTCALWSSTDDEGNPLDDRYRIANISPETVAAARADCEAFAALVAREGLEYPGTPTQMGYDFWLTRNGHGAGFWDRGYGAVGDRLSDLAETYGVVDLYVGDDGMIYG